MFQKQILTVVAGASLLLSGHAFAADNQIDKVITGIQSPEGGGEIRFTVQGSIYNPSNCANSDFYVIEQADDIEAKLSILLSAFVTTKEVSFDVSTLACSVNGRPKVSQLTVGETM